MRRASKILGWAFCAFCTIIAARGQPVPGIAKAREYIDQEVQRHRWELNVNAGNLFGLGQAGADGYYYLIKLNSKALRNKKRSRAWRFSLSPAAHKGRQYFAGDTLIEGNPLVNDYHFAPQFVLGHEWQRSSGRTMFFGGTDLTGQLSWNKGTEYNMKSPWDNQVSGRIVKKHHQNIVSLSAFLGAKMYLNHRISVSVESHVNFVYAVDNTGTFFENEFVERIRHKWKEIEPLPCYVVNLSYNF